MPTPAADSGPIPGELPPTAYIVLAGGSGSRVGAGVNKVYLSLAGRPVLSWSLRHAADVAGVTHLVLVTRHADHEPARHAVAAADLGDREVLLVDGGATRHGSEQNALAALRPLVERGEVALVAVHDGARPLADAALIGQVLAAAARHGAALPGVAASAVESLTGAPAPDGGLVAVQTPQAFEARTLLEVFGRALWDGFEGTDTSSVWERYAPTPAHVVPSSGLNLKVTYPGDLEVAARVLAGRLTGLAPAPGPPPR